MIPASGAGGPGFDPRNSPFFFVKAVWHVLETTGGKKKNWNVKVVELHVRACGVVVSRLLCMQKASGSNPDKSKFFEVLFLVLKSLQRLFRSFFEVIRCLLRVSRRPRGPMDKASVFGTEDCRFESYRGHFA